MNRPYLAVLLVVFVLLPLSVSRAEEEKPIVVEDGRLVSLEYTLTLDDGSQADSNVGEQPLSYRHGEQQILPALEQELAGMAVSETKEITLTPEQGYGPVDPNLTQEVETQLIPEDARKAGTQLVSEDSNGRQRVVRVQEVRGDRVLLDFNHPLAGQTLHFDVKVLAVE